MTDLTAGTGKAGPTAPGTTLGDFLRAAAAHTLVRRAFVLVMLAAAWQAAAVWQDNPLMLPSFLDTAAAFVDAVRSDQLMEAAAASLGMLLKGYVVAIAIALVFVSLAVANGFVREVLQTLTAMFNPLPAIALLPIALLWFGLGEKSLLFVQIHAVLWPFALALLTGFEAVPETQRLVGRNYGLKGPSYVLRILVPAALPSILSGLKIGWAFAWRTLIAAELVFGMSSSQGGARMVHLPQPQRAPHRQGVRRPRDGDPDRPGGGGGAVPHHRGGDRPSLGHAALTAPLGNRVPTNTPAAVPMILSSARYGNRVARFARPQPLLSSRPDRPVAEEPR